MIMNNLIFIYIINDKIIFNIKNTLKKPQIESSNPEKPPCLRIVNHSSFENAHKIQSDAKMAHFQNNKSIMIILSKTFKTTTDTDTNTFGIRKLDQTRSNATLRTFERPRHFERAAIFSGQAAHVKRKQTQENAHVAKRRLMNYGSVIRAICARSLTPSWMKINELERHLTRNIISVTNERFPWRNQKKKPWKWRQDEGAFSVGGRTCDTNFPDRSESPCKNRSEV